MTNEARLSTISYPARARTVIFRVEPLLQTDKKPSQGIYEIDVRVQKKCVPRECYRSIQEVFQSCQLRL